MRKSNFILLLILFFSTCLKAQKFNNVWAFGNHAGLNFNEAPVGYLDYTAVEGIKAPYFASSICNKYGTLLFYTDGITVWNGQHNILDNHFRWPWSGNVVPLICPYPANDTLFYIFAIGSEGNKNKLQYLTINTNASGGQGEIVYPPAPQSYFGVLLDNASLLLAGTNHCNGKDTWIVSYASGKLYSYLITKNGVSTTPVVSSVGQGINTFINAGWSNIKFSANGEKLVLPLINSNKVLVFDFNNATGTFSNTQSLNIPKEKKLEDVELSPDGSKLYFASLENTDRGLTQHYVFQMDLKAPTTAAIEASLFNISTRPDRSGCTPHDCFTIDRSMQLGPDGKIYISMREVMTKDQDLFLSVIEDPNKAGGLANYKKNAVNVNTKYKFINYNYIRSGSFSLKENGIQVQTKGCLDKPVAFNLLISNPDSVIWDFGDAASPDNTSRSFAPEHLYPAPGGYTATAIIYSKCKADTAKKYFVIQNDKAVHIPANIKDSVLCQGDMFVADATAPNAINYVWENEMKTPVRKIEESGEYAIKISNDCSFDFKKFTITYEECNCESFIPSAFTPNNDGLNDQFKPVMKCAAKEYLFKIFNRYGGVAFSSKDAQKAWKGDYGTNGAPSGVYTWVLQYKNPNTNKLIVKTGNVLLIR